MKFQINVLSLFFVLLLPTELLLAEQSSYQRDMAGSWQSASNFRMEDKQKAWSVLQNCPPKKYFQCLLQAIKNKPRPFNRMIVFGDSLSDSGNYFIETREFSVRPFEAIPTDPYLIGQLHFSNGKTWIERLARDLRMPNSGNPSLAVPGFFTNYAVGRSRARIAPEFPELSNLTEQVNWFLNDFENKAPHNDLYVVWIGVNDARDALESLFIDPSGVEAEKIIAAAISATFTDLVQLHQAGARRFLILNIPNLAIIPAIAGLGDEIQFIAEELSRAYNFSLEEALQGLEHTYPAIKITRMDMFELLDTVVNYPQQFGLSNVTDSCITPGVIVGAICKKPNQYLFWDFIHPTKKAHEIIAKEAEEILEW